MEDRNPDGVKVNSPLTILVTEILQKKFFADVIEPLIVALQ